MVILIAPAPLCPSSCLVKKLLSEVASSVCLTKQYVCQDPRPRNLNIIVMLKTSDLLPRGKMPQGGGILPRLPEVCSKCHVKFRERTLEISWPTVDFAYGGLCLLEFSVESLSVQTEDFTSLRSISTNLNQNPADIFFLHLINGIFFLNGFLQHILICFVKYGDG